MKKTIITFASAVALASSANAQISGTISAIDMTAETASFDFRGLTSIDLTGINDVQTGTVGGLFFGVRAGSAPTQGTGIDAFQGVFSEAVRGLELTFSDFDANGTMSWTFANAFTLDASGIGNSNSTGNLATSVSGNTLSITITGLADQSIGGTSSIDQSTNGFVRVTFDNNVSRLDISEVAGGTISSSDLYGIGLRIDEVVPEPSSVTLLVLGGLSLLARRKRA